MENKNKFDVWAESEGIAKKHLASEWITWQAACASRDGEVERLEFEVETQGALTDQFRANQVLLQRLHNDVTLRLRNENDELRARLKGLYYD